MGETCFINIHQCFFCYPRLLKDHSKYSLKSFLCYQRSNFSASFSEVKPMQLAAIVIGLLLLKVTGRGFMMANFFYSTSTLDKNATITHEHAFH